MTKLLTRLCVIFLSNLCIGIAFQLGTSLFLPALQLAFLDLGVFRTFAGLGLVETAILALTLTAVVAVSGSRGTDSEKSPIFESLAFGFIIGAAATLVVMYFALRLPFAIVSAWAAQTVLQLATAICVSNALLSATIRKKLVVGATSLVAACAFLYVAYLVPTPLPNASFTIATPDLGEVTVDCFFPDTAGPYDAVVLLHGVEGATNLTRRAIHYPNAKAVSQKGYATFFVRYFEACPYTDLFILDEEENLDVEAIEEIRLRDYKDWIAVAQRAIAEISEREDVEQLAVIGYSLGCYVGSAACSELCKQNNPPDAFVGNFGAIWPEVELPSSFPPTQFYHGEEDKVIPLQAVKEAVAKLSDIGTTEVSLFTFPGQGHLPEGPASPVMRTSTEAFLARTLRSDDITDDELNQDIEQ